MDKIKFSVGDERRFLEYVNNLKDAKKVILVSHTDLDGIASAKVVEKAVKPNKIYFKDYVDLNDNFIDELIKEKPSHIIFTDLVLDRGFDEKVGKIAKVMIIDHHKPEFDFNSDKVAYLNAQGVCATYIAYYLFSKIKDLSKLDWLVACASVADFCYMVNSQWMKEVYKKYGDEFKGGMLEGARTGKFWDIQWRISLMLIYFDDTRKVYDMVGEGIGEVNGAQKEVAEVQNDFDMALSRFEREKIDFRGGYLWEVQSKYSIKAILTNWLSVREHDKTFIFTIKRGDEYSISARRQDGKVDVSVLLKRLVGGLGEATAGGHIKSAGGSIKTKDASEFIKRVKAL